MGEIWQPAVTESLEAYLNECLVSPQSDKCINARSTSPIQTFCIPAGEGAKCRQVRDALEDFLVASRCDRQCVLVALGGGVVGDLVGFVASTFLRGVRWVYVPTSLLSMVDSSVGGKTAINSAAGKNLFGSFYPAHLTLVSISFLGTLSVRELRNGFAEVVKSALLCGKTSFFDQVELLAPSLRSAESARRIPDSVWHEIILQSISLKMLLIQGDLTESQNGSRCLLNLGHTVGHALEYTYDLLHSSYERRSNAKFGCLGSTYTDTSYSDQVPSPDYLLHGEAVSIGLVAEGRISRRLGILQPSLLQRMQHVLTSCGLPITSPSSLFFEDHYEEFSFREKKHDSNLSRFISFLYRDKKNQNSEIKVVLLERLGMCCKSSPRYVSLDLILWSVNCTAWHVGIGQDIIPKEIHITPPGSKSISNRALAIAFLGGTKCTLHGLLYSVDTLLMIEALKKLSHFLQQHSTPKSDKKNSADSEQCSRVFTFPFRFHSLDDTITVQGHSPHDWSFDDFNMNAMSSSSLNLYVGNSGIVSRFLLPICLLYFSSWELGVAASDEDYREEICSRDVSTTIKSSKHRKGQNKNYSYTQITGCQRMNQCRPIFPLLKVLHDLGARFSCLEDGEYDSSSTNEPLDASRLHFPLRMYPSFDLQHRLESLQRTLDIDVSLSSQYLSSLLIVSPFLCNQPHTTPSPSPLLLRAFGFPNKLSHPLQHTSSSLSSMNLNTPAQHCTDEQQPHTPSPTPLPLPPPLPYVNMTLSVMRDFGFDITPTWDTPTQTLSYSIPTPSAYHSPGTYFIEPDATSASYWMALAVLHPCGPTVVIPGLGTASRTQGDLAFATTVLRPLGCEVRMEARKVVVSSNGGNGLRSNTGFCIDMGALSDTFMTAAVLLCGITRGSVVSNDEGFVSLVHRITGIASQRLKESNRIQAMVTELRKLGVHAQETDDGIDIHSKSFASMRQSQPIYCYGDHRIAMSFAILSCRIPGGLTIVDPWCVEKTYPEFWDHLNRIFHLSLKASGTDAIESSLSSSFVGLGDALGKPRGMKTCRVPEFRTPQNTVLHLVPYNNFIDLKNLRACVRVLCELNRTQGWNLLDLSESSWKLVTNEPNIFLNFKSELAKLPAQHPKVTQNVTLILCPPLFDSELWSSLLFRPADTSSNVSFFDSTLESVLRPVRQLSCSTLVLDDYGINHLSEKALSEMRKATSYEYLILGFSKSENSSVKCKSDFSIESNVNILERFLNFISSTKRWDSQCLRSSHMLSLTLPTYNFSSEQHLKRDFPRLVAGCDVVELRADLLEDSATGIQNVAKEIQYLRFLTPDLYLLFTVRSVQQGGKFVGTTEHYAKLISLALRYGCEFVDIEHASLSPQRFDDGNRDAFCILSLAQSYSLPQHFPLVTLIVGSYHDPSITFSELNILDVVFSLLQSGCDIVKIVLGLSRPSDQYRFQQLLSSVLHNRLPFLAVSSASGGALSRILGTILSPVTHELLPFPAASGQLTLHAMNQLRAQLGLTLPGTFYVVGDQISYSYSPTLHRTAFHVLGLPHSYHVVDCPDFDQAWGQLLEDPTFRGASITIPHKEKAFQMLRNVSPHAQIIGCINTIARKYGSVDEADAFYGENTDWVAIFRFLRHWHLQRCSGIIILPCEFLS